MKNYVSSKDMLSSLAEIHRCFRGKCWFHLLDSYTLKMKAPYTVNTLFPLYYNISYPIQQYTSLSLPWEPYFSLTLKHDKQEHKYG